MMLLAPGGLLLLVVTVVGTAEIRLRLQEPDDLTVPERRRFRSNT